MNLTSTVIIASYNGEQYLYEQLESILQQQLSVTKVMIQDDCSTDRTAQIACDFIAEHHLADSWHFQINPQRLGWRENFIKMLAQTNTDLVFYCDQDDIWYDDKVSQSVAFFSQYPDMELLVSDFDYLPSGQNLLTMFPIGETACGPLYLYRATVLLSNLITLRPGCAMAVRKSIIPMILDIFHHIPIDGNGLPQTHDQPTWLAALLHQSLYHVAKPLLARRAHADSAWQLEKKANLGHFTAKPTENEHFLHFLRLVGDYLDSEHPAARQSEDLFKLLISKKIREAEF